MATQLEEDFIEDEQPLDLGDTENGDDGDENVHQRGEGSGSEGGDNDNGDDSALGAEEVDIIGWGSEAPIEGEDEPEGVRNLRKRLREREDELRTLKGQPKQQEVGPKPVLEDFDYDDERYDEALLAWHEDKRAAKERESQAEAAARKQRERWEAQARDLDTGYGELRAPGKDTAKSRVEEAFPGEQYAYLVKATGKNAPAFIYALGNASDKMDELKSLAAEGSWAEFIATAAIMGREVNVQRRKPNTAPEQERRGGTGGAAGGVGGPDARLEKLERDAAKTGDRSALIAYKAKLNK